MLGRIHRKTNTLLVGGVSSLERISVSKGYHWPMIRQNALLNKLLTNAMNINCSCFPPPGTSLVCSTPSYLEIADALALDDTLPGINPLKTRLASIN